MRERAGWSGVVEFSLRLQHTAILSVGTEVQGFFLFRPPIWKMPMNASCNIRSHRKDLTLSSDNLDWHRSYQYKYMLFAGWEVRIVKNCERGLENDARGPCRGQHFQVRGHSFSLYGPTLSRQITYLFFSKLSNKK